jgi:hypothetical protein
MSTVPALGSRPIQFPVPTATAPSVGLAARSAAIDKTTSASDTVSLSSRARAEPADQAGNATVDITQQFIANLAASLFGGAHGASPHPAGGFSAKGEIVTADGHSHQYTVEVRYRAQGPDTSQAGATQAAPADDAVKAPDTMALMGRQLPAITFPGSLADLFKLLDRDLQLSAPGNSGRSDAGENGAIALRLVRLVNSAALIAPRARADDPRTDDPQAAPVDRSKALAKSYGAAPATGKAAAT